MRRSLAWLSAIPLMFAGSQAAHALAYRWVYPSAHVRLQVLIASGHGYLARLPVVLAIGGAISLLSFVFAALDVARGRKDTGPPPWAFGLLPLAAFALQEILELSLHTGTFFWRAVEAPTFLPGLALQLPFALLAFLAARLLLRAAERAGLAFAPARAAVRATPLPLLVPRLDSSPARANVLARRLAKRGPPLPA